MSFQVARRNPLEAAKRKLVSLFGNVCKMKNAKANVSSATCFSSNIYRSSSRCHLNSTEKLIRTINTKTIEGICDRSQRLAANGIFRLVSRHTRDTTTKNETKALLEDITVLTQLKSRHAYKRSISIP